MSNYFSEVIQVQTRKKVPTEDGRGFMWVNDRIERVEVHLEIDMQALAQTLGAKAFLSKGNKAIEASGAIVARVAR
jgi:hypothetical protein